MRRLPALTTAAVLAVLIIAPSVSAHTSSTHYPQRWSSGSDVYFRFTAGFPGGDYRSRVLDGASQWTSRGGVAEVDFFWAGGSNAPNFDFQSNCNSNFNGINGIHWADLDYLGGGVLGVTYVCRTSTTVVSFQMAFDNDRDWYRGTGDANDGFLNQCIPSCQDDFWSVASHEFGHASGFVGPASTGGHFAESDAVCPNDDSRHTMCPSIYGGTERQRTLEDHDVHTFTGAY